MLAHSSPTFYRFLRVLAPGLLASGTLAGCATAVTAVQLAAAPATPIDRQALVTRHNPVNRLALMVAGWDGRTEKFPGFPKDGKWAIRALGLHSPP